MAASETKYPLFYAFFVDEHGSMYAKLVEIVKTKWDHEPDCPYYWCTYNTVGTWPGTDSTEWIEYIPPDAFVERDGELFWRQWNGKALTFTKITSRFIEG